MLLLIIFTLDKNNERLTREHSSTSGDLFIQMKLKVSIGACQPESTKKKRFTFPITSEIKIIILKIKHERKSAYCASRNVDRNSHHQITSTKHERKSAYCASRNVDRNSHHQITSTYITENFYQRISSKLYITLL